MNIIADIETEPEIAALRSRYRTAQTLFESGNFAAARATLDGFGAAVRAASRVERIGRTIGEPAATVVVVSHRDDPLVDRALEEIALQSRGLEIVLVTTGNERLLECGRRHFDGFTFVTPPFPLDCSSGRNLGAAFAGAPFVIFLDDDGIIEGGCLAALVDCAREANAVAVRGRVVPLTHPSRTAGHYDLGVQRLPSLINCEGVSLWRREALEETGGFDPLLAGYEGVALCGLLWRFHGPQAFLYEPKAVLRHDYVRSEQGADDKKRRYARARRYVDETYPHVLPIHETTARIRGSGRTLALGIRAVRRAPAPGSEPVSILTTARNGAAFLADYVRGWKAQTARDFEIVFVDDGSRDGTAEQLARSWGDDRLVLIERPFEGRGASLNAAVAAARHDLCLIADVDDISLPDRIAWTQKAFAEDPQLDYLSFLYFTETELFRGGRPLSPFVADMDVRMLFGMPAPFPAFAFRRHRFALPFDAGLRGGVDCDWLLRNAAHAAGLRGRLEQRPMVYYRRHEDQITSLHHGVQQTVRGDMIRWAFGRVLGPLAATDVELIDLLVDRRRAADASEKQRLAGWIGRLIARNDEMRIYEPDTFGRALCEAFDAVTVSPATAAPVPAPSAAPPSSPMKPAGPEPAAPPPAQTAPPPAASPPAVAASTSTAPVPLEQANTAKPPKPTGAAQAKAVAAAEPRPRPAPAGSPVPSPSEIDRRVRRYRFSAEQAIAVGDFRTARWALREALKLRPDPEIRARLTATHKFWVVRALSRSRPYEG